MSSKDHLRSILFINVSGVFLDKIFLLVGRWGLEQAISRACEWSLPVGSRRAITRWGSFVSSMGSIWSASLFSFLESKHWSSFWNCQCAVAFDIFSFAFSSSSDSRVSPATLSWDCGTSEADLGSTAWWWGVTLRGILQLGNKTLNQEMLIFCQDISSGRV